MIYCPKCGHRLMVTQIIQGKPRTHPCACLCEIAKYESCTKHPRPTPHKAAVTEGAKP